MALLASCSLKERVQRSFKALATEHRDIIRAVCGNEQYMGLPAGCEVVVHSVRYLLEADPH